MDDAVEGAIRKAVDKLASTQEGQKVLGGLLTMAASGATEGLEEFIGDWMEWQMPRIYGGDVASAQETLESSLYDFTVGNMAGLVGGVTSVGQYDTVEQTNSDGAESLDTAGKLPHKSALISDQTALELLGDQRQVEFLTRKGELKLTKDMNQNEKIAAVRDPVERIARAKKDSALLTQDGIGGIVETDLSIEYNSSKMNNYLLNLNHPKGGSKAKFLYDVLGYRAGDGEILYNNIKQALNGLEPVKIKETSFGTRLEYDIKLFGRDGKSVSARVVVVLQRDNGKISCRIITLYPGKKEPK